MTITKTTRSEQIGQLLTEVDIADLPDTIEIRKLMCKAEIMAMMLNGELEWAKGIILRKEIDDYAKG